MNSGPCICFETSIVCDILAGSWNYLVIIFSLNMQNDAIINYLCCIMNVGLLAG